MRGKLAAYVRKTALLVLVGVTMSADMSAFAQSRQCTQLSNTLKSLNNNREYRSLQNNVREARKLGKEIQKMESTFVRGGCQKQLKAEGRLSGSCRTLGRRILNVRKTYNKLAARVETGQAVAQQREQALQQIARFGCGQRSNSRSRVEIRTRAPQGVFGDLINRLFGGGELIDDSSNFYGGQSTLRTVCVRKCDGYYWPVSFSTVGQFLEQDASQCQSQCPGAEVDLYYYGNPGETPDQMVNLNGTPYKALENAFAYRQAYNSACTCKKQIDFGTITVSAGSQSQPALSIVAFEDVQFPLPLPDPRKKVEKVTVAELIVVPLPIRRPVRPGEEAPKFVAPSPVANAKSRIIQSGGRDVRLVGPDTIYAQSKAEDS